MVKTSSILRKSSKVWEREASTLRTIKDFQKKLKHFKKKAMHSEEKIKHFEENILNLFCLQTQQSGSNQLRTTANR